MKDCELMKINLFVNRAELQGATFSSEEIVVVIDVLRASTTIIQAFKNGCKSVTPVAQVEHARRLACEWRGSQVLLCGERNEMPIPGFDLSNSPLEFKSELVRGKDIIFTSTNGAQLFDIAASAHHAVVASFVNVGAIADYLCNQNMAVNILCAGIHGSFGLEDVVCGGMLVAIIQQFKKSGVKLNDGALAAYILYQQFQNDINGMLHQCSHGRRLIEIGHQDDLVFCAAVDTIPIIPIFKNGKINRLINHYQKQLHQDAVFSNG
ncbi:MAG: 2-phosphosulfolactate phosphatase [bacterium]|nr:2-phosphosulfolactate phosphatase [bacterium]